MIEILLSGGPSEADGSLFKTDAFSWPSPEEVEVVTGGKKGAELLDLEDDEVRPGERLHIYRRSSYGHACRPCRMVAWYEHQWSAPKPAPTLFEAGIRSVGWMATTVYSDRGSKKGVTTLEATLLPSAGYRSEMDVQRWVKRFRECNPGLKVEVR